MREQELWKEFRLHNFEFKGVVMADTTEVVPFESPLQVNEFIGELEATKGEPTVIERQVREFYGHNDQNPVERPVVVIPDFREQDKAEPKPVFHCLPAIIRRHRDALYGETYATVKYDSPFTFEAYVVDQTDFNLLFWTSGPAAEKISEGSVVYPKLMEKRWDWGQKRGLLPQRIEIRPLGDTHELPANAWWCQRNLTAAMAALEEALLPKGRAS